MKMSNEVKPGVETTEYEVAKSGSFWGVVSIVLGAVVMIGSVVADFAGADSKIGILVGGVIGVVGAVQKLLTDRGYISSRTQVKSASTPKE